MLNYAPSSTAAERNHTLYSSPPVRNLAIDFFLAGKPLKCRLHSMMVCIGTTPEGWGFLAVFSLFANKSSSTKRTKKSTRGPLGPPLWRGMRHQVDIFQQ